MTFGERVLSLTQDALLPKVVDNTLNSNVLALRLIGNGERGMGESIKKAIKYQNSGTAGSFSGLDTFSASPLETKVRLSYDMRAVRQPIAISGMDASANAVTQTQVTQLVKNSLEETEQELVDEIGDQLYGTGTGNSNKDLLGLGAIVDDATDVATIGGLARATYSVLNATRTAAAGGALSLSNMGTLYSAVASGSTGSTPTMGVTTETVWDLYESLLTSTVRENYSMMGNPVMGISGSVSRPLREEGLKGTQGFTALTFRGIGLVRDEKCTSGNLFFLNEKWMKWYGWDAAPETGYKKVSLTSDTVEGLYAESPMSSFTGFNWSGFRAPTNQFGVIADMILLGNLTSWQPRRHGRPTGVTTT